MAENQRNVPKTFLRVNLNLCKYAAPRSEIGKRPIAWEIPQCPSRRQPIRARGVADIDVTIALCEERLATMPPLVAEQPAVRRQQLAGKRNRERFGLKWLAAHRASLWIGPTGPPQGREGRRGEPSQGVQLAGRHATRIASIIRELARTA
jgi:hypothetical protein